MVFYRWLRPVLFRMDPELAHRLVLGTLARWPAAARIMVPAVHAPSVLRQSLWDLDFAHPVGLEAGLDKDGVAVDGLFACGFSFVETGTVTPKPQPGNPEPRLFRLVEDQALINRMGFNNRGVEPLRDRLKQRRSNGIVGVNIGKNKHTPNEDADSDYLIGLTAALDVADYIVMNVSSPNTPGLRDLQALDTLTPLLTQLVRQRDLAMNPRQDSESSKRPPILVKLAPDLADDALASLAASLVSAGADGFIATNTTSDRTGLSSPRRGETGGLSGRPLERRATEVVRILYEATDGRVPIIGSGGIFDADDAYRKILAGASLVQLYTAFIYYGPDRIGEIVRGLSDRLRRDGFTSITQAVGQDIRSRGRA